MMAIQAIYVMPQSFRSMKRQTLCLAALLLTHVLSAPVFAGESLQPGFYYHDPETTALKVLNASSGAVCGGEGEAGRVCEKAIKVTITGNETCDYSPNQQYPCTRFGYEFDYTGATPNTAITCDVSRLDPMGRKTSGQVQHELSDSSGHIFYSTFRTYAPVDERMIFSELHECGYEGQLLATIEYIIYYEPGTTADDGGEDRPGFYEVPNACEAPWLPEDVAAGLLGAEARPSAANAHLPILSSQCLYSSRGTSARGTGMVFKFMLSDMFNVDKVPMMQLRFNASFATGGGNLKEVREELGDMAFVFDENGRTTLLVITGFGGRDDFAGRSTELMADYYLDRPEMSHDARLRLLLALAHEHLQELQDYGRQAQD